MSEQLAEVAKALARDPRAFSRNQIYAALSGAANKARSGGESPQQALVRLLKSDADAQRLFHCHQLLQHRAVDRLSPHWDSPLSSAIAKAAGDASAYPSGDEPDSDENADGDGDSFSQLVDKHQRANPKLSRSSSIDRVMATREGRKAMMIEKSTRLNKALRY
jgi:hypothetical protein